ncbi:hypothetical protein PQX77_020903 [Marasmius sp. AFHP31]|nr:hypothetical protein PQX77_020903 [Marasmius sp. AFHP31]
MLSPWATPNISLLEIQNADRQSHAIFKGFWLEVAALIPPSSMALIHYSAPFTYSPDSITANPKVRFDGMVQCTDKQATLNISWETEHSSNITSGINDATNSLLNTIRASQPKGTT